MTPVHTSDFELVPRVINEGYTLEEIRSRREWTERKTSSELAHAGCFSVPSESLRGNIENPIGMSQIPLGVAGPLLVHGSQSSREVFCPFVATRRSLFLA